jgi:hypothetical protein
MAGFNTNNPWQPFGIERCVPGAACLAPQAVLLVDLLIH